SIAEKYLLPYNRKIWKLEPREQGLDWVSRIPKPPLEDVVKSAMGIETEGYTHQLYFRYPLHGGFEALIKAIIKPGAKVHLNTPVERIRRTGAGWRVWAGGQERDYENLVLAMPIMDALGYFENVPQEVQEALR